MDFDHQLDDEKGRYAELMLTTTGFAHVMCSHCVMRKYSAQSSWLVEAEGQISSAASSTSRSASLGTNQVTKSLTAYFLSTEGLTDLQQGSAEHL